MIDIYSYTDYRILLKALIKSHGGRGQRSELAKAVQCQPTYISHVLSGRYDLSFEQAEAACRHFCLSEASSDYFLVLLSEARAGTTALKKRCFYKAESMRAHAHEIKNQVNKHETVTQEHRVRYYSGWEYGAIHMLLMLTEKPSIESIAKRLHLAVEHVADVIDQLQSMGIIILRTADDETYFEVLTDNLHLERDAPELRSYHTSLRLKAMEILSHKEEKNLQFSTFLSCSQENLPRIKSILLDAISQCSNLIQNSSPETVGGINIDFYEL